MEISIRLSMSTITLKKEGRKEERRMTEFPDQSNTYIYCYH